MALNHVLTSSAYDQPELESAEEPHFMAQLDRALATSQTDISPWTCAKDWIDAGANQVTFAIQVFVASTQSAEIEDANFGGDMVYQVRLAVTIFT
jgi:hypothetical protein